MDVVNTYRSPPAAAQGAVVALGNFDGVHQGHQAVIARARAIAETMGAPLGVMVFEPHPREFFQPGGEAFRLMSLEAKARFLETLGVDYVFALPFDKHFAALSAQEFILDVLVKGLSVIHLVAGPDFRFGKGRGGDMSMLAYTGEQEGFGVTAVEPVNLGGEETQISSTMVRAALKEGRPEEAARLMGHPWSVEGRVTGGEKRGRTIGFPTANLQLDGLIEPKLGVYAVYVDVLEGPKAGRYEAVVNLGRRPTFGHTDVVLEAHLFDFQGDLYDLLISVDFLSFIRPEQKFDGIEALKTQIREDIAAAKGVFAAKTEKA